ARVLRHSETMLRQISTANSFQDAHTSPFNSCAISLSILPGFHKRSRYSKLQTKDRRRELPLSGSRYDEYRRKGLFYLAELAGIHDALGVERGLDGVHHVDGVAMFAAEVFQ